jgi:hypothetical protein
MQQDGKGQSIGPVLTGERSVDGGVGRLCRLRVTLDRAARRGFFPRGRASGFGDAYTLRGNISLSASRRLLAPMNRDFVSLRVPRGHHVASGHPFSLIPLVHD